MSRTGKPTGRTAFTFIEMLFVLIIVGVLAAAAIPVIRKTVDSYELTSFASTLRTLVTYFHQRAVVEGRTIYLTIDTQESTFSARESGSERTIRNYRIPLALRLETEQKTIGFYPDGTIDAVIITVSNQQGEHLQLTTKGIYGGIKTTSE